MIKIMLVEDDKSLREIYGVRLLAEGYDIVSAGDGEEALAIAIKERPELVISDVMMPKISGFDMLDILRSTTETNRIKVIMMTALSSEEQRARGESLGADRYLVKSQVGIEDVIKTVHEVLGDTPNDTLAASPPNNVPAPAQVVPTSPASTANPRPAPNPTPADNPANPAPTIPLPNDTATPVAAPVAPPIPPQPQPKPVVNDTPKPASLKNRIIQPISDPNAEPVNMSELLDKELAHEAGLSDDDRPEVTTTAEGKQSIEQQLDEVMSGTTSDADAEQTGPEQTNPEQANTEKVEPDQAGSERADISNSQASGEVIAGPDARSPFSQPSPDTPATPPPPPPVAPTPPTDQV